MDQNGEEFLKKEIKLGQVISKKYSRVLIVGVGGGCDVFSAYALNLELKKNVLQESEIVVAQTKRKVRTKERLKKITWHVYGMREDRPLAVLEESTDTYGTTVLTESLPRDKNSPIVFELPHKDNKKELEALKQDISELDFDLVIGVDTGGDCITGVCFFLIVLCA